MRPSRADLLKALKELPGSLTFMTLAGTFILIERARERIFKTQLRRRAVEILDQERGSP